MATTEAKPAAVTENGCQLEQAMRGRVIRPHDPGYDEARKLFNGMIERRPALIARPGEPVSHEPEHQAGETVRG